MRSTRELNLENKKVLLRADFDVPVSEGEIKDKFRIEKQREMLDYLVNNGAKVIIVAHISSIDSFSDIVPQLHIILGKEINFIKKVEDISTYLNNYAGPALLENIRQFSGEMKNDKEFAKRLAQGFDLYVNNDFAVCHRAHASISAIAEFLPAYPGFIIEREVGELEKAIETPSEGKVIIIGGAKASTKIPVIKNLLNKAEYVLTGGVVANDILKERGIDIGKSVSDEDSKELLKNLDLRGPNLYVPEDYNVSDDMILDIGDKTVNTYKKIISQAKMIIWNGPMGWFEKSGFEKGTYEIAKAIVESSAYKIIGGRETTYAVDNFGLSGKFDFISTGGGAMLAFLAGQELPGLKALGYYAR